MGTDCPRARRKPLATACARLTTVAMCLVLGACAQTSELLSGTAGSPHLAQTGAPISTASTPTSELEKATEYWGKEAAKSPRDGKAALNYARNLKALGRKQQALAVLQGSYMYNENNRDFLSEYGRLALELDQVSTAAHLLERADDPAKPDWRIQSARGTVLAKQGRYKDAVPYFERARDLSGGQPSVLNNLAMAYAMDGQADRAEGLLRQAANDGSDPRVRHNLALVLGLQGKYGEAKTVTGADLGAETAQANVDYLQRMVKLEPKTAPAAAAMPPPVPEQAVSTIATSSVERSRLQAPAKASVSKALEPEAIIEGAIKADIQRSKRAASEGQGRTQQTVADAAAKH